MSFYIVKNDFDYETRLVKAVTADEAIAIAQGDIKTKNHKLKDLDLDQYCFNATKLSEDCVVQVIGD